MEAWKIKHIRDKLSCWTISLLWLKKLMLSQSFEAKKLIMAQHLIVFTLYLVILGYLGNIFVLSHKFAYCLIILTF